MLWIVNSLCLDSTIAVTLGYFSLEFGYQRRPYGAGTGVVHLWNTLLVLMDLFVSSIPVKLVHVYPSVILAGLYGIFTYVYYLSGGLGIYDHHYLYKILDYKHNPSLSFAALMAVLAFMLLGRILVYYSYKLRKKLYYTYYLSNEASLFRKTLKNALGPVVKSNWWKP
ncbi:hypothetical protein NQ318_012036 [Aromia moschata]|uniref:Uncharacterized protein n=1 Tax=Aromia moschata TaxID=1265417 RepID=A0AAV8X2X2_9CUCU|nr:hypothetical protein NQ318_012036 [Aromia moschata]